MLNMLLLRLQTQAQTMNFLLRFALSVSSTKAVVEGLDGSILISDWRSYYKRVQLQAAPEATAVINFDLFNL